MILTCPECATRYQTKKDAIGPNGRTVRCTKCSASWFVAADSDALALKDNQQETITAAAAASGAATIGAEAKASAQPSLGAHVEIRDKVDQQRRRRRLTSVGLIWAIPLMLLLLAAILAYVFRQDIVNKSPGTATFYKTLGIDVSLSGLNIENPVTRSAYVDGKAVLVINGAVRNITSKTQDIPLVEFSLHNKADETLATWLVDTQKEKLGEKGRVTFVSEYPNPPLDAVKLRYKFADETAAILPDNSAPIETLSGLQE